MVGIYKITNTSNGKSYIGQSIDIKTRWSSHKSRSLSTTEHHDNMPIHSAMAKYGIDNFTFEVLEECLPDELDAKEKHWIARLNTISPDGYNVLPGGQGFSRKEEDKQRYCSCCGAPITKYGISGLCLSCVQRKVDRPSKEELYQDLIKYSGSFTKLSKKYGVTDNAIRKWCDRYGLSRHSADYKQKQSKIYRRKVAQIDLITNEIIATYSSIKEAAIALNKTRASHITEVCQGKLQQAYGYKWQYLDNLII